MSEQDAVAATATLATPGAVLSAARRAQNLEVADVARQLRLSTSQVNALESDAHDQLPGTVFVRGFIRNYARLLKVDVEALLPTAASAVPVQDARAEATSPEVPFPNAPSRSWPKVAAGMAVAVLAALALYEFGFDDAGQVVTVIQQAPPAAVVVDAQPAPAIVPPAAGDALPAAIEQPAAVQPATVADVPPAAPSPIVPPAAAGQTVAAKPGEARVRMVFEAASWVEIRDRAGHVVFSQLSTAGSEQRVNGTPPLTVIVGNARGVRLIYNDQPVDLARHTKVDVARLTLE